MASAKKGSKKGGTNAAAGGTTATTSTAVAGAPAAAQEDPKKEAIFECIQDAFENAGLSPITTPLNQIVWSSIPQNVIIGIGTFLRNCFTTKFEKDPGDLIGPLLVLSTISPVMTVAKLIEALEPLVKP